jgi:hypothetical protein
MRHGTEDRGRKDRGQKAEDRGRRTEDGKRQRSEGRSRPREIRYVVTGVNFKG